MNKNNRYNKNIIIFTFFCYPLIFCLEPIATLCYMGKLIFVI